MNFQKRIEEASTKYENCTHEGMEARYCCCLSKDATSFEDGATFAAQTIIEMLKSNDAEPALRNYCPANIVRWLESQIKSDDRAPGGEE